MGTTFPDELKRLVEQFHQQSDRIRTDAYNETQVRIDFIDPMMKALGWDMNNAQGFAEQYRDKVVALPDDRTAHIEERPKALKGDSVYYTPTDIVRQTVSKLLDDPGRVGFSPRGIFMPWAIAEVSGVRAMRCAPFAGAGAIR